jgi:hypothetical protein
MDITFADDFLGRYFHGLGGQEVWLTYFHMDDRSALRLQGLSLG